VDAYARILGAPLRATLDGGRLRMEVVLRSVEEGGRLEEPAAPEASYLK
jgi:hypothetical protein